MGGASSRRKGHQFEREVANMFKAAGFTDARRQLEYHEDDCRGVDIQGTGPYKVQCKKLAKYVSINTIGEVVCDRQLAGEVPILVTAGDGLEAMAILPLVDLLALIKRDQKKSFKGS